MLTQGKNNLVEVNLPVSSWRAKAELSIKKETEKYIQKLIDDINNLKNGRYKNKKGTTEFPGEKIRKKMNKILDFAQRETPAGEAALMFCEKEEFAGLWRWYLGEVYREEKDASFRIKPQFYRSPIEHLIATRSEYSCNFSLHPPEGAAKQDKPALSQWEDFVKIAIRFNGFYAIRELLMLHLMVLKSPERNVGGKNKRDILNKVFKKTDQAMSVHGTPGYLLAVIAYTTLGSLCRELLNDEQRGTIQREIKKSISISENELIEQACYKVALYFFYMAWALEEHSSAAINNAFFGGNPFKALNKKYSSPFFEGEGDFPGEIDSFRKKYLSAANKDKVIQQKAKTDGDNVIKTLKENAKQRGYTPEEFLSY